MRIAFETAEAMLNPVKTGLERICGGYAREDEKAAWFLAWENEIAGGAGDSGQLIRDGTTKAALVTE